MLKNGTRISIELHRLGGEYTVKSAVIEPNDGQYTFSYLPLSCDYAPKRRGHSQVQFFCFQINSTPIIELQELRRTRRFVQVHRQSTASGNSSHLPIRLRFRTFVVPTVPPSPAVELSRSREPVMS